MSEANADYKVLEKWYSENKFSKNPETGNRKFTLDQARIRAARVSDLPYSLGVQIHLVRRLMWNKVVEVWERGHRIK